MRSSRRSSGPPGNSARVICSCAPTPVTVVRYRTGMARTKMTARTTWLAYDRQIVDDELYALWGKFAPGVRIFVLSDSCHSGTVVKDIDADVPDPVSTRENAAAESPRYRALPRDVMIATYRAHAELYDDIQKRVPGAEQADPDATVLLISGCRDDQLSLDGFSNGLFTENLRAVWDDGAWEGDTRSSARRSGPACRPSSSPTTCASAPPTPSTSSRRRSPSADDARERGATVRWAIVIGIDEYGSDGMRLFASVSDARKFRDWVLADDGGRVPESNLRLLLSGAQTIRAPARPCRGRPRTTSSPRSTRSSWPPPITRPSGSTSTSRDTGSQPGSPIATRVRWSPRVRCAPSRPSLAVRSIAEYLETTTFADQFLFIDACRNVPWAGQEFEIGRWPVPPARPGRPAVQQFILYATSPGRTAAELGWPGEATGAFTSTLLEGLGGTEDAKAWSWERNCYEVRWERLASFVNQRMRQRAGRPPEVPARDWPVQIPQDTGTRGVADRDRDVPVVSFASGRFSNVRLTVDLEADADYDDAEVSVLDAVGEPVVRALGVTGKSQTFQLAPKTYAVRATTTTPRALLGSLKPIELYRDRTEPIGLRPRSTPLAPRSLPSRSARRTSPWPAGSSPGTIAISSPTRLRWRRSWTRQATSWR